MGILKIPESEHLKIIDMYNNGMSTVKIGELYNCSYNVIARILEKHGIARNWNALRKYSLNEHYFDKVDTPNKAYILGLLYADGYNNRRNNCINLKLQEDDMEILELIKTELSYDAPLTYVELHKDGNNLKNIYILTIRSAHMSSQLDILGVHQCKSLILEFPSFLKHDLYSHFIRGYMDGDGCVYCFEKTNDWSASFISTNKFCHTVKDIVLNELGINSYVSLDGRRNDITSNFRVGGNCQVMKFLSWIYKDADLKFKRKYVKYQQFLLCYDINNSLTK